MSIDDRDWYRQEIRKRQSFTRRSDWAFRIGAALGLVFVLILAWKVHSLDHPAPPERPRVVLEPESTTIGSSLMQRPPAPYAPAPETIYRCVVDGRVTYSGPVDCRGVATVLRTPAAPGVDAPVTLTAYQQEMLRSADARIARDASTARQDMQNTRRAQASNGNECEALAFEIRSIDATTRQPLSGLEQDRLRSRRQAVSSRQSALRC